LKVCLKSLSPRRPYSRPDKRSASGRPHPPAGCASLIRPTARHHLRHSVHGDPTRGRESRNPKPRLWRKWQTNLRFTKAVL